jgi:nucleoside-diphosphate-sugar epimerase
LAKILSTGCAGFIGSHLTGDLIAARNEVAVLDINVKKNIAEMNCEEIEADVRDAEAVAAAVRDKDLIFHLAAASRVAWGQERPHECFSTNVMGTPTVLESVRGAGEHCPCILTSSREVYGEPARVPVREDFDKKPVSIYGASKLASEYLVRTYCTAFCIPYAIVRFSNVYGSHRDPPERVIPTFARVARSTDTNLSANNSGLEMIASIHGPKRAHPR